jgi:hypothetical protein
MKQHIRQLTPGYWQVKGTGCKGRCPAIEIAGYTLQSLPSGRLVLLI